MQIVHPLDPSKAEAFAGQELARYLEAVTGAHFSVAGGPGTGGPRIVLASADDLAGLCPGAKLPPLPRDAFHLRTVGQDLVIVGHSGRSVLFGAYAFLERYVGCRWYMPGPLGEVLPSLPALRVPRIDDRRVPPFAYRIASGFTRPEYIDWAAKHGLQVWHRSPSWWDSDEPGKRELCLRGTIHHALDKVAPAEVLGPTHPEYFGLLRQRRLTAVDRQQSGQPCVTHPDLPVLVAKAAGAYFDAHPAADFFSLCPNDNQNWCECRFCRGYDCRTMERFGRTWPVVSDRYFTFVRQVALRLAVSHPGKSLYCFSYQTYTDPPAAVRLPSNVIVSLCHMVPACYAHRLTDPDCPKNAAFDKLVRGWADTHDNLWYYAYTCKSMWQQMPWPIFRRLAADIRHLRDQRFQGFYSQGSQRIWGQLGINFYVMVKALWDPDLDVDAVLEDYYHGLYGPACEPMRRYHETLAKAFGQPGIYVHHEAYDQAPAFMTPELVSACDDALAAAHRAAGTDRVRQRIQPVATAWEFAKLYLAGHEARQRFERTRAERDIRDAVTAYDGIVELSTPPRNSEALSRGSVRRYVEPKLNQWRSLLLLYSQNVEWSEAPLGDGSFESGGSRWGLRPGTDTRTAAIVDTNPKEGKRCLHLRVSDPPAALPPSDWATLGVMGPKIKVAADRLYRVQAWVRVPARMEHTARGAIVNLLGYDAAGERVTFSAIMAEARHLGPTDGWTLVEGGGAVANPEVKAVRIRLGMAGRGECFFDHVRMWSVKLEDARAAIR